ncbi:hypothetical protein [Streptomyces sp. NPDC056056]|uniref:hypothetical protein n=1 Tax=Streptomyces sp. NPDC056056 TaxID=3345698 RepID=UPI0035DB195B
MALQPGLRGRPAYAAWSAAPAPLRAAIEACTGRVIASVPAPAGRSARLTLSLTVPCGQVFLKATPTTHRHAHTLEAEARIAPFVKGISPALLGDGTAGGWRWLLLEHIPSRHADLSASSTDLGALADVLQRLMAVKAPQSRATLQPEDRWADLCGDLDLGALAGGQLVHTDLNPGNILIRRDGTAALVDWARPGRGAGWLSIGFLLASLIHAGTSPESAQNWARQSLPAWAAAPDHAVDTFVAALARRRAEQAATSSPARRTEREREFRSAQRWHAFRTAL